MESDWDIYGCSTRYDAHVPVRRDRVADRGDDLALVAGTQHGRGVADLVAAQFVQVAPPTMPASVAPRFRARLYLHLGDPDRTLT